MVGHHDGPKVTSLPLHSDDHRKHGTDDVLMSESTYHTTLQATASLHQRQSGTPLDNSKIPTSTLQCKSEFSGTVAETEIANSLLYF